MNLFRVDRKSDGLSEIAYALKEEFGIYLVEVPDTGTDDHWFVLRDSPTTEREAQHYYDFHNS
jgi:hypothetical protein